MKNNQNAEIDIEAGDVVYVVEDEHDRERHLLVEEPARPRWPIGVVVDSWQVEGLDGPEYRAKVRLT